jgi:hypothetical protein
MERNKMTSAEVCCGGLFYAEVHDGTVVLECCTCGRLWRTQPEGGLAPFAEAEASSSSKGERVGEAPSAS